jgi:hypothetical protein
VTPTTMQSEAMRRSGAAATAGDEGDEAMTRSGAADGIRKT